MTSKGRGVPYSSVDPLHHFLLSTSSPRLCPHCGGKGPEGRWGLSHVQSTLFSIIVWWAWTVANPPAYISWLCPPAGATRLPDQRRLEEHICALFHGSTIPKQDCTNVERVQIPSPLPLKERGGPLWKKA